MSIHNSRIFIKQKNLYVNQSPNNEQNKQDLYF